MFPLEKKKVWVAGHNGLVGRAIVRRLGVERCEVVTATRQEVDLRRQQETENWFERIRPEVVVVAAAKVGGIHANRTYPVEFLYDNLAIELNILDCAFRYGVEKLLMLGSSCVYPRDAVQPLREECLLTGRLESTNQWYAIAKIAGISLCEAYRRQHGCDFVCAMPTNLYGPWDNFHGENSHVPAALLQRMHRAKVAGSRSVTVWGSGKPRREFMYVDDAADACVFLLNNYSENSHINVGTGSDITIAEFADEIRSVVGFSGDLEFDTTRPDGTPRKVMDVSRLSALGWNASTTLRDGLRRYYQWFLEHLEGLRMG